MMKERLWVSASLLKWALNDSTKEFLVIIKGYSNNSDLCLRLNEIDIETQNKLLNNSSIQFQFNNGQGNCIICSSGTFGSTFSC